MPYEFVIMSLLLHVGCVLTYFVTRSRAFRWAAASAFAARMRDALERIASAS